MYKCLYPPISLLSLFFCRDCAYTLDRVQYFDPLIWGFLIRKIVILLFCYCVSLIQNVPFLSNINYHRYIQKKREHEVKVRHGLGPTHILCILYILYHILHTLLGTSISNETTV